MTLLGLKSRKGECFKDHARDMKESCGHVELNPEGIPAASVRCDRLPHTRGAHHACGAKWDYEWGG